MPELTSGTIASPSESIQKAEVSSTKVDFSVEVANALIELLASLPSLDDVYRQILSDPHQAVNRLSQSPPQPQQSIDTRQQSQLPTSLLLPASIKFLDQMKQTPLLPAPPSFENAFAPFEPMFHAVFYRRYPYYLLADATQEGLLHIWKKWKSDMSLLEQKPSFVVQAALWGAGNARKKRRKIEEHELPMLPYERYVDIRVADSSRDPKWMQNIDLKIDIQLAICQVEAILQAEPDGNKLLAVLNDIVIGRRRSAARRSSPVGWRKYDRCRDRVEGLLREALRDYAL